MKLKQLKSKLTEAPNQPQQNNAQLNALVRAGLMKPAELPTLKMAIRKHAQVGDVAKLPKNQRDALMKYNSSLTQAALGSTQSFQAVRKNLQNSFEITDKNQLCEALQDEVQPPPMLVLRRQGIRIFPDGKRVALYTNDKLGLTFTIPYRPGNTTNPSSVIPGLAAEETELEEVMESLEQVARYAQEETPKQTSRQMKFADGSKTRVSHGAAKAIHMVHGALNDDNKKKFADMLKSPEGFDKAANFAMSKVKFTIGSK
jgi:hypothetical protein